MTGLSIREPRLSQPRHFDRTTLIWMFASAIVAAIIAFGQAGAFMAPPQDAVVPLADWLSAAMTWFTAHFRSVFRTVTWLLMFPLSGIRSALVWLPWPAVILICAALGYAARGWKL